MFEHFFAAYVEAALWSSVDDGGTPLDSNYEQDDIHPDSLERMKNDCRKFLARTRHYIKDVNLNNRSCTAAKRAGHDFWLNRNGHGCGFWDGDWKEPAASRMDNISKEFGTCDIYVGDDGKVYI